MDPSPPYGYFQHSEKQPGFYDSGLTELMLIPSQRGKLHVVGTWVLVILDKKDSRTTALVELSVGQAASIVVACSKKSVSRSIQLACRTAPARKYVVHNQACLGNQAWEKRQKNIFPFFWKIKIFNRYRNKL